jgi:cysteinyl-tRNA synthetase
MYGTDPAMRVRVATMQMVDAAALWFQSVESQLDSVSWEQFCEMVRARFDRDHHELLVRQILHIRQTSTVSDYITRFTALTDQLLAYNKNVDHVYFITRFIDGLHHDIHYVLLVQRP